MFWRVRKGRQLLVVLTLPQWTSVEMGTLLCSDRAAYVSRTPAGRACTSARLARSMLLDVVDVVGVQQRARGQEQPHSPASKNSQRAASREASRSTRHSLSCLGKARMYIWGRLAYRTCFLSVLGPLAERPGPACFYGQMRSVCQQRLHTVKVQDHVFHLLDYSHRPPIRRQWWLLAV
jgi:hypothetical protein